MPAAKKNRNKQKSVLDKIKFDPTAKPCWEVILELSKTIPPEELAKLPTDGAENHDYYLYGGKKVSEMNVAGKKNNKAVRISECSEKDLRKGTDYKPAWKKIADRAKNIPVEESAKIPSDLAEKFEFYMYGSDS